MKKPLLRTISMVLLLVAAFTNTGVSAENRLIAEKDSSIIVLYVDEPYMYVNGEKKEIDPGAGTAPAIFGSRTLVPVRSIVESLGGTIGWVQEDNKANIYYENKLIEIWVGHKAAYIDGVLNELDVEPCIVNKRALLPLRFVAESLDCKVMWDEKENKISIFKNADLMGKSIALQEVNPIGGLLLEGTGRLELPVADSGGELRIMVPDNASIPFKEYDSSQYLQNIHRKTGVKVHLNPVPVQSFYDRVNLMIAANDLPDILWEVSDFQRISGYAQEYGVFLPYSEYLKEMPNLSDILYSDPGLKKRYSSDDGNMYILPFITEKTELPALLVREDILNEERLKIPETYEEFYTVLKYLKQKYPKLIPLSWQPGMGKNIYAVLADSWGSGFGGAKGSGFYLQEKSDRYQFGPIEENFRSMVDFLAKMYREGLIDAEFLSERRQGWEEKIVSGRTLTTISSTSKIKYFNDIFKKADSKARMTAILPPAGKDGKKVMVGGGKDIPEYGAVISAKVKDPAMVCRFMDWFYSAEGALEANYGIAGETYVKNDDGTVSWMENMKNSGNPLAKKELGSDFGTGKGLKRYLFEDNTIVTGKESEYDDRLGYSLKLLKDNGALKAPDPILEIKLEAQNSLRQKEDEISEYVNKYLSQFIVGEKAPEEWNNYVEGAKKLGVLEVLEIYNEAYRRYKDR